MRSKPAYPGNWRNYQAKLQKDKKRQRLLGKLPVFLALASGAVVIFLFVLFAGSWLSGDRRLAAPSTPQPQTKLSARPEKVSRENLPVLMGEAVQDSSKLNDRFVLEREDGRYSVTTTILPKLQEYIVNLIHRSKTYQSAVVVMNPYDGRIQSMASHSANGNGDNICLKAEFPAASLFKIVTAAAALETAGFTPEREVTFQGGKHTLYKYQLKPSTQRFTTKTDFSKAFASSNNSVFGKLGIYHLGQAVLTEYAGKCLFNDPIPFDLPVDKSVIEVPDDEFGLAEIASGFNKITLISPLHATLLAAMVANNGEIPAPWLIETIRDDSGKIIYSGQQSVLRNPIRSQTAQDLKVLMEESVRNGTSRKAMWRLRQKKIFKNFEMGAKTGTINDKTGQFRYDWLTIYALAPDGTNGISVGVLGVHDKILGTRSAEMARAIIDFYFSSNFLN
jgi:penicillin-binding protein A